MPSRIEKIKKKLDAAKTKRAVLKEKVNESKKYFKKEHGISTVKQAKALKAELEIEIKKMEKEVNTLLDNVEEQLDEIDWNGAYLREHLFREE